MAKRYVYRAWRSVLRSEGSLMAAQLTEVTIGYFSSWTKAENYVDNDALSQGHKSAGWQFHITKEPVL